MANIKQWKMWTGSTTGGLVIAFIVAGCGGGSGGSLFSGDNGSPKLTTTPTPSGTVRGTPTRTPAGTPTKTPIGTPKPTVKPTIRPTVKPTTTPGGSTPLPTPVANAIFTGFSISGSLDATGNFSEDFGAFNQFRLVRSTSATPTPIGGGGGSGGGTPVPTPTVSGSTVYTGTYALSNGEKGGFSLLVDSGEADGGGFPLVNVAGYTLQTVTLGNAVVTLKIIGSTGAGTVKLTSLTGSTVATGTITITRKLSFSRVSNDFFDTLKLIKR